MESYKHVGESGHNSSVEHPGKSSLFGIYGQEPALMKGSVYRNAQVD